MKNHSIKKMPRVGNFFLKNYSIKKMTRIAILATLFCVFGPISIRLSPSVPMTLQPLMLSLITLSSSFTGATTAIVIYLLLGAIGVPVFAGYTAGIGHLFGGTGGFLWAFAFFPVAYNLFIKTSLIKNKLAKNIIGLALSHATLYIGGMIGMYYFAGVDISGIYSWASKSLLIFYSFNIAFSFLAYAIFKAGDKAGIIQK